MTENNQVYQTPLYYRDRSLRKDMNLQEFESALHQHTLFVRSLIGQDSKYTSQNSEYNLNLHNKKEIIREQNRLSPIKNNKKSYGWKRYEEEKQIKMKPRQYVPIQMLNSVNDVDCKELVYLKSEQYRIYLQKLAMGVKNQKELVKNMKQTRSNSIYLQKNKEQKLQQQIINRIREKQTFQQQKSIQRKKNYLIQQKHNQQAKNIKKIYANQKNRQLSPMKIIEYLEEPSGSLANLSKITQKQDVFTTDKKKRKNSQISCQVYLEDNSGVPNAQVDCLKEVQTKPKEFNHQISRKNIVQTQVNELYLVGKSQLKRPSVFKQKKQIQTNQKMQDENSLNLKKTASISKLTEISNNKLSNWQQYSKLDKSVKKVNKLSQKYKNIKHKLRDNSSQAKQNYSKAKDIFNKQTSSNQSSCSPKTIQQIKKQITPSIYSLDFKLNRPFTTNYQPNVINKQYISPHPTARKVNRITDQINSRCTDNGQYSRSPSKSPKCTRLSIVSVSTRGQR